MIQEYLLKELDEKEAIKVYEPQGSKGIHKKMFSADNEKCWYVQFFADGENEEIAKQLSEVDKYIQSTFHVTILEDGCSAYFNKRLYPLVSEFEYKLRKLLYLTSAINHDEKSAENITNLDSQDLGQIFSLLFIDTNFFNKTKEEINKRNRDVFSKADVIDVIKSLEENPLWDKLLGKGTVPTLRGRFNKVREYRNDIMHFHHVNWKRFKEIQALYKTINDELDKAVHNVEVTESKSPSKPTFNQTLEGALQLQGLGALNSSLEEIQRIYKLGTSSSVVNAVLKGTNRVSTAIASLPNLQSVSEQVNQLVKVSQSSSVQTVLQESLEAAAELGRRIPSTIQILNEAVQSLMISIPKINILPEVLSLQNGLPLSHISNEVADKGEKEKETGHTVKNNDNRDKTNG